MTYRTTLPRLCLLLLLWLAGVVSACTLVYWQLEDQHPAHAPRRTHPPTRQQESAAPST